MADTEKKEGRSDMGKELSVEEKVKLIEECLSGRMKYREAARRAGVHISTIQRWTSHYRTGGVAGLQVSEKKQVYSEEIKQKAVEEYRDGRGSLLAISEKYGIRSPTLILEWAKVYNRHKESQEETGGAAMARTKYTQEDRVRVVKEYLESGQSYTQFAAEHGMSFHLVSQWVRKYQKQGVAGLEDRRGRRIAAQEPRTPEEELRVRNAQLEHEIYLLKMENDLLKKLQELERGKD